MWRELAIRLLMRVFEIRGWLLGRLRPDLYTPYGLQWISCPWPRQAWVKDTRDYEGWSWLFTAAVRFRGNRQPR